VTAFRGIAELEDAVGRRIGTSPFSALSWQAYQVEGLAMAINYGANRVRLPAPVPVPSRVRGVVDLASLQPRGNGYVMGTRVTVEIDDGEKPACVAEILGDLVPS
jgi:acyl dehydratase